MADNTVVAVKEPERRLDLWHPFALFEEMREDLERRFGKISPAPRPAAQEQYGSFLWAPRMDVFEKDGNLIVEAELPGIKKEDIQVTIEDGNLIIRAERQIESETKEESYYRMERAYGSFYRRLSLPAATPPEKVKAEYKNGVLDIRIPLPAAPVTPTTKVPIS